MGARTEEELVKIRKDHALELEKLKKDNKYCFFITKVSKEEWIGSNVDPGIISELEIAPLAVAEFYYAKRIKSITHTPIFAYEELGILTTIIYE